MNIYSNFNVKTIPEDFLVEECFNIDYNYIPNIYALILLRKKNYTTFEAIQKLKDFFNLDDNSISYAGLKDEDGITIQKCTISVKKSNISENSIQCFNSLYSNEKSYININFIGYCEEPMRIGELIGNSFKLTLRNLSDETANKLLELHKCTITFPNYYDSQRFGLPNKPHVTHLVGKSILNNDYKNAYYFFAIGNNIDVDKSLSLEDKVKFFSSLDNRNLSFYLNSYASYKFNSKLSELLSTIEHSSINICEDLWVNLPNNQYQIFSTGIIEKNLPIIRYSIENGEIKERISKRNIMISSYLEFDKINIDQINKGKKSISVAFHLPSGCYATMLMNQLNNLISNM